MNSDSEHEAADLEVCYRSLVVSDDVVADATAAAPSICRLCVGSVRKCLFFGCSGGHAFCEDCIHAYWDHIGTCPTCGGEQERDSFHADGSLFDMWIDRDEEHCHPEASARALKERIRLRQKRHVQSISYDDGNVPDEARRVLQVFDEAVGVMVGLKDVKGELRDFLKACLFECQRGSRPRIPHIRITGPSGVGKTTLATAIHVALQSAELVTGGLFIRTPSNLNNPAAMELAMLEAAGGVLFLDEVYSLPTQTTHALNAAVDPNGFRPGQDGDGGVGGGPVNTLVILAGYEDKMARWLNTNEGLPSRFPRHFQLASNSPGELMVIADRWLEAKGLVLADNAAANALQDAVMDCDNAAAVVRGGALLPTITEVYGSRMLGAPPGTVPAITRDDVLRGMQRRRKRSFGGALASSPPQGGSSSALASPPQQPPGSGGGSLHQTPASDGGGGGLSRQSPPQQSEQQAPSPSHSTMDTAARRTVVGELQRVCERRDGGIVTLRTAPPSLASALSERSLQLLGADNPEHARDHQKHKLRWMPNFLANLKSCLVEGSDSAFPDLNVEKNATGAHRGEGEERRKFQGEYVLHLRLRNA